MNEIKKQMSKPIMKAICIVFCGGIFIHLFGIVNVLHNYDDIAIMPSGYGTGVTSGRWFLTVLGDFLGEIWGNYNIPYVNGIIFILFLSISTGFLMDLFQIRSWKMGVLIGFILIVFPASTSTLFFKFTSGYYGMAILLSIVAAWVIEKYRYGFLISMVCTALSLGIYQAYLPITISLLVLLLLRDSLVKNKNFINIINRGVRFCLSLIGGLGLYYLGLKISLKVYNVALNTYQGVSEMGKIQLQDIPRMIINSVEDFLKLPVLDYCDIAPTGILKIGYLLLGIISMIIIGILVRKKSIGNILITLFLCAVFPVSVNFITIMCPNSNIYTLMVLGFFTVLIVPVILGDCLDDASFRTKIIKNSSIIILSIMVFNYIYIDNVNYISMYYTTHQTENYLNSLVTQVRMTEGFDVNKKWAFIGSDIEDPLVYNRYWDGVPLYGGNKSYKHYFNAYSRLNWISVYFGYSLPLAEEKAIEEIEKEKSVIDMPCWPDEGSIKVIGDNVVIKLQNVE